MNKPGLHKLTGCFTALMISMVSFLAGIAMPGEVQAFGGLTENGTAAFMGVGASPHATRPLYVFGNVPLFERAQDSAGFIIQRTEANRWVLGVNESPSLGNGFVLSTYPSGSGSSVARLLVTPDGNVGIGTTSPTAKLEVAGSVKISESINKKTTNPPLFRWLPVTVLATYPGIGSDSWGIAFDGTNMWTASSGGNSVTRVTPTGNMTTYYVTGSRPFGIAFDGTNMWTSDSISNSVTRITPSGNMTTYYGTGAYPWGIAFDGTNMWTANANDISVTRITPAGVIQNYTGPLSSPHAIAFDGTNMWAANNGDYSVTRITPSGNMTRYASTGDGPLGIAFDGSNMWTANAYTNTVTRITPAGDVMTYSSTVPNPVGIAFDGTNMWTVNNGDKSVTKILVITK